MLEEFCETVNSLAKDPEVRVIIVKGEGSVFSAGIDFNSLGQMAGTYLSDAAGGGAPIRADIHQAQQWLKRLNYMRNCGNMPDYRFHKMLDN